MFIVGLYISVITICLFVGALYWSFSCSFVSVCFFFRCFFLHSCFFLNLSLCSFVRSCMCLFVCLCECFVACLCVSVFSLFVCVCIGDFVSWFARLVRLFRFDFLFLSLCFGVCLSICLVVSIFVFVLVGGIYHSPASLPES